MKTIKSRLLLLITAAVMTLCLCIGLAACGEDAFPAPENVKVEGNTLSWDAVEEAEGYTVKINDDQTAATATNSLDLTTVTAKLKEGANTLAVKVNAKEGKAESAYSGEVTYNYTPAPASTPFSTPTGLTIDNGILSWNAVSGATAYIVSCGTQSKEVTAASINLALFELTEGDTVTFTVKVKASGDKLESAAATSPEYVVPNPAEVINEAKAAIAEKKASLDGLDDEAVIAKLNEFAVIYEEYPDYVKEDEDVTAAYAELTEALETAKTNIKTQVDEFADEITVLIEADYSTAKPTKADYDALTAKQEAIAELAGAYTIQYWNATYASKSVEIANKQAEILLIPVEEKSDVFTSVNGANGAVTVLYSAINILGDTIEFETVPALSLTLEAASETPTSTVLTKVENNNIYAYTASFIRKADADYELKVIYSIGGGSDNTVVYKEFRNDIFFSGGNNYGAVNDNQIVFEGDGVAVGFEAHFDIYLASDITVGTNEILPTVKGLPLIKDVTVKNGMTTEEFRAQLARNYNELINKEYEVRFVVYRQTVEGDEVTLTNINTTQVSHDIYKLDLTEEDAKVRLAYSQVGMTEPDPVTGTIILGAGYNPTTLAAQFNDSTVTADNVNELLRFIIDVTLNGETKTFSMDCNGGSLDGATLKRNIYNLFKNETDNEYTLQIRLALREDSPYDNILRDSEKTEAKNWTITASAEDTQLPLASVLTNGRWSVGNSANIEYQWEATSTNRELHNGIDIYVYVVGDKDAQTYDFIANDSPLAVYNDTSAGYIAYSSIEIEILSALGKLPASEKVENYTFVFVMQAVVNENGIKAGYMSSAPVYATTSTSADDNTRDTKSLVMDWNVPDGNQLSFNAEGTVMVIAEQNQPAGRGSIYDDVYGVLYIEIKFTVDGNDYLAYAFKEDDNTLNLYANTDKSGTARNCDRVDNGWVNVEDFINWVNADNSEYAALTLTDLNGIEFSTKIVHDGSYYVGNGNYSSAITCPNS